MRTKLVIIIFVCECIIGCKTYATDTTGILSKIDTITIRGYYVINRLKSETSNAVKITKDSSGGTHLQLRLDAHAAERFVPDDSLKNKSLSNYLLDFYANTTQVYVSCIDNERLLSYVTHVNQYNHCNFKLPEDSSFYELSNVSSQDVFQIYYIEAVAVKFKLKNVFAQTDMVRSKIAECCIEPTAKAFDVICLTEVKAYNPDAITKLSDVRLWKPEVDRN